MLVVATTFGTFGVGVVVGGVVSVPPAAGVPPVSRPVSRVPPVARQWRRRYHHVVHSLHHHVCEGETCLRSKGSPITSSSFIITWKKEHFLIKKNNGQVAKYRQWTSSIGPKKYKIRLFDLQNLEAGENLKLVHQLDFAS